VFGWGGSFAAIKALIDHGLHAPDIAIGPYAITAPGFGIALAMAGGLPGLTRRDVVCVIVAGLFVVAVYHLALNAGERTTTAGTAGRLADLSAGDLLLVLYPGLVCTLAGYVLWTVVLRSLDPSRAVAYLYGVPVVAVGVGAITLGESVTPWLALGGLLVVGGVALSQ
jgi:O-acetylserine/cysteine efflux transporter